MQTLDFKNGDKMPALGLGTWKSKPGEVYTAVKEAIRLGYRHLDCAAVYANEPEIGKALSECFAEGLVTREELWITSKLWNDCHKSEHVRPALQKTLADLQLSYLDLYLVHWPIALKHGVSFPQSPSDLLSLDEVPIAETWQQMEAAADDGLCRHIGVSNFSVAKLQALLASARIKPEVDQVELHPYLQQPGLARFCADNGIFVTAYSPLGSMDRPDVLKTDGEPILLEDATIRGIAERSGISAAQALLRWSVQSGFSVIPKSVNPGRMKENLAAAELSLSDDDMAAIGAMDRHRRYLSGEFWAVPESPYTVAGIWDE